MPSPSTCQSPLRVRILPIIAACLVAGRAHSSVTVYDGDQYFNAWSAAAAPYTTIDFSGFPQNTFITDQYVNQGVLFTSTDPDVILFGDYSFPSDGVGLNGVHVVEMQFLQPTFAFAFQHLGKLGVFLYAGDTLVYSSPALDGGSVPGQFSGLLSSTPFDRVKILPWDSPDYYVYIDNMYFSSVPAPAGAIVLSFLSLGAVRSRRSRSRG